MTAQAIQLNTIDKTHEWKQVLGGCGILILGAYLRVPFYPISFTMHTCALWIIALTLSPRQALYAVMLYLGAATAGFPVIGAIANPLWMMGKSAGYFVAFPIAAYLAAYMRQRQKQLFGIVLGSCLIYLLGFLGLTPFVGPWVAFQKGVLVFIPSDALKIILASAIVKFKEKRNECFNSNV